jgi:hypothetical protein
MAGNKGITMKRIIIAFAVLMMSTSAMADDMNFNQPPPPPPQPVIINTNTGGMPMDNNGTFYMPTGGDNIISTKDGSFHQEAAGGYINTQTGQFEPSN